MLVKRKSTLDKFNAFSNQKKKRKEQLLECKYAVGQDQEADLDMLFLLFGKVTISEANISSVLLYQLTRTRREMSFFTHFCTVIYLHIRSL